MVPADPERGLPASFGCVRSFCQPGWESMLIQLADIPSADSVSLSIEMIVPLPGE